MKYELLKTAVRYDETSGKFYWIIKPNFYLNPGDEAGSLQIQGYISIVYKGCKVLAHRAAYYFVHGKEPQGMVDHINGNKTDNRIINLRVVSPSVNAQNTRKIEKNTKTKRLGVYPRGNSFIAKIMLNGKEKWIGTYKTIDEAHHAYICEKRKIHEGCTI